MITIIRKHPENETRYVEIIDGDISARSVVACIQEGYICEEHGTTKEFAEIIRDAISAHILKMTPQFKHDCPNCKFLGRFLKESLTRNNPDLYFCEQTGHPTVIARYSNEPSDYTSGMEFAEISDYLGEAKRRAIKKGFIKK